MAFIELTAKGTEIVENPDLTYPPGVFNINSRIISSLFYADGLDGRSLNSRLKNEFSPQDIINSLKKLQKDKVIEVKEDLELKQIEPSSVILPEDFGGRSDHEPIVNLQELERHFPDVFLPHDDRN